MTTASRSQTNRHPPSGVLGLTQPSGVQGDREFNQTVRPFRHRTTKCIGLFYD